MLNDRYELHAVIGRGGMSTVYKAVDRKLDRMVAVKKLNIQDSTSELRFLRESKVLSLLNHRSIVTVYDFALKASGMDSYIVMELVEGKSLIHCIGQLSSEQVLVTLRELADGLDYAHGRGVVHRDLKPANVFVTNDGTPKILDFGVAILVGASRAASPITSEGFVVGTLSYMCPEQISGGEVGPATDQFALAMLAFEMLTGVQPFSRGTDSESLAAILLQPPADPIELNSTLPQESGAVIRRALNKDPSGRFFSCKEFVQTLEQVLLLKPGWRPFEGNRSDPRAEAPTNAMRRPSASIREHHVPGPSAASTGNARNGSAKVDLSNEAEDEVTQFHIPVTAGVTVITERPSPLSFSYPEAFQADIGSGAGVSGVEEIEASITFYREQMSKEYKTLLQQMRLTYILWLVSVCIALVVLVVGICLFLFHQVTAGAATTTSSILFYFLQRVFGQREEIYRTASESKRTNVDYGAQWALVIQTIQGMKDPTQRQIQESRLVEVLTAKLEAKPVLQTRRKQVTHR